MKTPESSGVFCFSAFVFAFLLLSLLAFVVQDFGLQCSVQYILQDPVIFIVFRTDIPLAEFESVHAHADRPMPQSGGQVVSVFVVPVVPEGNGVARLELLDAAGHP